MPELGVILWERNPRALAAKATSAEAAGFASVSVGDHILPGLLSPLAASAVIASATSTIRFGPLVLNNDFRHPGVVAQEAAALSRWSGGRFELALGSGYNRREYRGLGIAFAPRDIRAARLAEGTQIIRRLLDGKTVTFDGDHYKIHELALGEAPPRVPILIGGNSDAILRVAAEHADVATLAGYSPGLRANAFDATAVERQIAFLNSSRRQASAPIELHALVQWHEVTANREEGLARAAQELETTAEVVADSPYVLVGTVEQIAEQMHAQQARFGISRWTVFGDRPEQAPAAAFASVLPLLAI